ncbi:hypothetical protein OIU76_000292 [Salix suchowensis]|nr:hypothetical protein OIU76_000292 [Salix suchowensis]
MFVDMLTSLFPLGHQLSTTFQIQVVQLQAMGLYYCRSRGCGDLLLCEWTREKRSPLTASCLNNEPFQLKSPLLLLQGYFHPL